MSDAVFDDIKFATLLRVLNKTGYLDLGKYFQALSDAVDDQGPAFQRNDGILTGMRADAHNLERLVSHIAA